MAGNSFGQLFRITTFGESHGVAVGVVVDGCPAGLEISEADIQQELDRRKPGQSYLTSPRKESDTVHILSGVFEGRTIGTPIMLLVMNQDAKPEHYEHLKEVYRPSHADFTYEAKYGQRDWRGSGRASARTTVGNVAAGAIAQKYLKEKSGMEFVSFVQQIEKNDCTVDPNEVTREQVESNIIRCPDQKVAEQMEEAIDQALRDGDSVGGVICGIIKHVPAGLGEPVFDKISSDLGKAMLSINATKGFEIGSGFAGTRLRGSQHNDEFYMDEKKNVRTRTNHSGGIQGGISNGENILFRVAFKPTATIRKEQKTVNRKKEEVSLKAVGRHDPCVLPRAVPIVDAMAALVMMDHWLRHKATGTN